MSLIVLMSRDNAVYDALSFQLDVTVSDSGFVYRGGFLHDALAGYLHNSSLFIHDFDYFFRCAEDLILSREVWSNFVSDNFSPYPDAIACEICDLVFEDLPIRVALVPMTRAFDRLPDTRKKVPYPAYEMFSSPLDSPVQK
jgi:hypothetical protein